MRIFEIYKECIGFEPPKGCPDFFDDEDTCHIRNMEPEKEKRICCTFCKHREICVECCTDAYTEKK